MAFAYDGKEEAKKEVKGAEATKATPVESVAKETVVEAGVEYGSKQGALEFMASLVDPSNPITRVSKNKAPDHKAVTSPQVVGYQFKLLEDMLIPECGLTNKFKGKGGRMDFIEAQFDNMVPHKKGDIVNLTPFEAAKLLSQDQFNGKASGGEFPVKCSYTSNTVTNKKGEKAIVENGSIPNVVLKGVGGASILDFRSIEVLTVTTSKGEGGRSVKERKIVPGFEKWECLTVVGGTGTGRTSSRKADGPDEKAISFNKLMANRAKKLQAK